MKKITRQIDLFFLRNSNKGIPNLMLYIALGNAIVAIFSMFNGGASLFSLLCFDKTMILQGQVWRLVTYVFTQTADGFLGILFLYFFYLLGRHVEQSMGTLRFNLFYLSGVVLMDAFAMIFSPIVTGSFITVDTYTIVSLYQSMAYFLHLSLLLTFATTNPDSQFLIFFIIPIKAWVIGILYLVIVLANVFNLTYPVMYFPHNLFPLVALANYLIFMGKDMVNLLPLSLRLKLTRKKKKKVVNAEPIHFRPAEKPTVDFAHRCTICGRTDKTNPELEFRYCSRCQGFHCYCIDHISNHTHITE